MELCEYGNKLNNNISNLEWCSREYNIQEGFRLGIITPPWLGKTGKNHCRSKSVLQLDLNENIINEFGSAREAARISKVSYGTISNVLINKGKTAGGYIWKYKH